MARPSLRAIDTQTVEISTEVIGLITNASFVDGQLSGTALISLSAAIAQQLRVPHNVVHASISELTTTPVSRWWSELTRTIRRLVANRIRLVRGQVVMQWVGQPEQEWTTFLITYMTLATLHPGSRVRRGSWSVKLLALDGYCTGIEITETWSSARLAFHAREIGFSAAWGKYPMLHPTQLTGLRFEGLVDPVLCREQPAFRQRRCRSRDLSFNRGLLRMRNRLLDCPRRFTWLCHQCAVGYDQCPAGCHPATFQIQECPTCQQPATFDPYTNTFNCRRCASNER